jgi:hypothetical protein
MARNYHARCRARTCPVENARNIDAEPPGVTPLKKFLDWLKGKGRPPEEESDAEAEVRRERELQRLAKLTKTANLPGLEQEPKKKDD